MLGSSGSGKGTQSELLARKFNLKMLDGGEYLRKIMASKSKESRRLAEKMNKGNLAPTDIIRDWMKKQIFAKPLSRGLIFSGQPRMIGEAKLTMKWFRESGRGIPLAIFLRVSGKEVLKRLKKRYICAKCKKVYTLDAPPMKPCGACGGQIIKRADDTPKLIRNRLAYFKKQVAQTLKFFKKKGILIEVNGEQGVEEVHKEIIKKISKFAAAR
jgi:adenylate kinase